MKPRGTTVSVTRDDSEQAGRRKPWGVCWTVYREGFAGRGKRKSKWYATEEEAQAVAAQVRLSLETGVPVPVPDAAPHWRANTLGALAPDWLAYVKEQREVATHDNYEYVVRHYLAPASSHVRHPGLGDLIISDATLTTKILHEYVNTLHANGARLSVRRRVKTALSAFLSYARLMGHYDKPNPCFNLGRAIKRKGEAEQEPQPTPFEADEIARIFDYIEACEPQWLTYFQFAYDTGVRPGEATGLQWDDIDFARRRAHLQRSWSTAERADKDLKNHETRWIDLSQSVVDRLLAWRPVQRQELLRRVVQQSPYVFTSIRGKRLVQDGNVLVALARIFRGCKIKGHSLYDFRHSFASHHLSDDWSRKLTWVSKQLGHKQVSTTERHYFKYSPKERNSGFADEIRRVK